MPCPDKKHTPISTEKQRRFFGAEYARKKLGKRGRAKMSKATLKQHLKETKGKKLKQQALRSMMKRRKA